MISEKPHKPNRLQKIGTAIAVVGALTSVGGGLGTALNSYEHILLTGRANQAATRASITSSPTVQELYARRYETYAEKAEEAHGRSLKGGGITAVGATLTLTGLRLQRARRE
jgi:hypothetical protein